MGITTLHAGAAGYRDGLGARSRPEAVRGASAQAAFDDGAAFEAVQPHDGEVGRVLLVDDDDAVRMVCAINLRAEGLHVLEAVDGARGLEEARSHLPDLVLTDVTMPGLDGFQFADALRRDERTRRIPLIFLSGEVESDNVERARALGALAYVTKPFNPLGLASFVAQAVVGRAGSCDLTTTSGRPRRI